MKTLKPFDILLPDVAEPEKFAVVSCDQFTSQRDYWEKLAAEVGDAPSALDLIFPEVYLEDGDAEAAHRRRSTPTMGRAISTEGVFRTLKDSFVLVRRETAYGNTRLGIVAPVDLEEYSYVHPTEATIRATEGVVANRIPPRLAIRENALDRAAARHAPAWTTATRASSSRTTKSAASWRNCMTSTST